MDLDSVCKPASPQCKKEGGLIQEVGVTEHFLALLQLKLSPCRNTQIPNKGLTVHGTETSSFHLE